MLQKPSNSRQTASSRERERENKYNNAGGASPLRTTAATSYEGPLSSDVSPVSTVEKRAVSLPPPLSLQPWDDGAAGGPKLNGGSCGTQLHNCIAISRKVADRRLGNHKSKRTRTCISMEQREKLNAFAERAGWTVVGQRKETIEAACQDIGESPPPPLNATFPCVFVHRIKENAHHIRTFLGLDCPLLSLWTRGEPAHHPLRFLQNGLRLVLLLIQYQILQNLLGHPSQFCIIEEANEGTQHDAHLLVNVSGINERVS